MEAGDGLVEGIRGEIRQQVLEHAKGHGALVEVLLGLRPLQAHAVRNEIIQPPVFPLPVQVIGVAIHSVHQRQGMPGAGIGLVQMPGDGSDVVHQGGHVLEHMLVDFLQNIGLFLVRHQKIGAVDVAVPVALTLNRAPFHIEGAGSLEHCVPSIVFHLFPQDKSPCRGPVANIPLLIRHARRFFLRAKISFADWRLDGTGSLT